MQDQEHDQLLSVLLPVAVPVQVVELEVLVPEVLVLVVQVPLRLAAGYDQARTCILLSECVARLPWRRACTAGTPRIDLG